MAGSGGIAFAGIASGLDTSAIINSMMRVDQARVDGLVKQRGVLDMRISTMGQLRLKMSALQSKVDALRFQSQVLARTATTDTVAGQPAIVSASATSTAVTGTYKVWADQLATTTKRAGASGISDQTVDELAALGSAGMITTPTAGRFTVNGVSIDASAATTLQDFVNAINGQQGVVTAELVDAGGAPSATPSKVKLSAAPGVTISVGSAGDTSNFLTATKLSTATQVGVELSSTDTLGRLSSGVALSSSRLAAALNANGGFTINGVAFTYDAATDTLGSIMAEINASAANVSASYDAVSDRVTLTSKATGAQSISVADTGGGNLMAALAVDSAATEQLGLNAQYRIDAVAGGAVQTSTSNTIVDAVPGLTVNLLTTNAAPVTVTVGQDTAKPLAAMKEFVTALNDVLDFVRTNSRPNATTGAAGSLQGNLGVRMLADTVRNIATNLVSGAPAGSYRALSDLGVTSGAVGSTVGTTNTFSVDETKFTEALSANPQGAYDMLNSMVVGSEGVFSKMRTYLGAQLLPGGGLIKSITDGSTARQTDLDRQIARVKEQMSSKKRRLEMQFSRMEQAIASLQAQGQRMQSQLGNGNGQ